MFPDPKQKFFLIYFIYLLLRKANRSLHNLCMYVFKGGLCGQPTTKGADALECRHSPVNAKVARFVSRARFPYIFVWMFPALKVVDSTLVSSH